MELRRQQYATTGETPIKKNIILPAALPQLREEAEIVEELRGKGEVKQTEMGGTEKESMLRRPKQFFKGGGEDKENAGNGQLPAQEIQPVRISF